MNPEQYLLEIKSRLFASPVVNQVNIVEEYVLTDRGYFRARLRLSNNDFLEVAEYFVEEDGDFHPARYRYQWMDSAQEQLRKRWDNVEHFPDLPNFPYHVHVGSESQVEPGSPLKIIDLIEMLESLL